MKSLNLLLLFFFLFAPAAGAQTGNQAPSSQVSSLQLTVASVSIVGSASNSDDRGDAQVTRSGQVLHLHAPAEIQEGDLVSSSATQTLLLKLQEGSLITIAPNTALEVIKVAASTTEAGTNESTTLRIERGLVDVLAAKIYQGKTRFRVRSKDATMGVRGTEFVAEQDDKKVSLHTLSGKVEFYSVGKPNDIRLVEDGRASTLVDGAIRPSEPAKFDQVEFQSYLKSKGAGFKEQLDKNRRAHTASSGGASPGNSTGASTQNSEKSKDKPQKKKKAH